MPEVTTADGRTWTVRDRRSLLVKEVRALERARVRMTAVLSTHGIDLDLDGAMAEWEAQVALRDVEITDQMRADERRRLADAQEQAMAALTDAEFDSLGGWAECLVQTYVRTEADDAPDYQMLEARIAEELQAAAYDEEKQRLFPTDAAATLSSDATAATDI